jgi:NHLM bacteriocin system ABC transporter peptidase/ATP-binding protein
MSVPSVAPPGKRVKTPTVLQMEAVECGAAALGIVLGYYERFVPLEVLREQCGVSRDGTKASNILKVARQYGMKAKGFKKESLEGLSMPLIVFWNFNHFLVVEGVKGDKVYINDPAAGPGVVSAEEFDQAFTGVVLVLQPGPDFEPGGEQPSLFDALRRRLVGYRDAVAYLLLASALLAISGLLIPTFSRVFVDDVLIAGSRQVIAPLLIGMGLTAVLRGLLVWLQQYYLLRFETKLSLTSSSRFFWHVLRLPVDFFHQRFHGEIGSRVEINDRVAALLSGELATNALNIVMMVFFAFLMFQYNVVLTLVGIGFAAVNLVALRMMARMRVNASQKLLQERGKLLGTSMWGLQMVESLKANGAEDDYFSRWSGYQAKAVNAEQEYQVPSRVLSAIPPTLGLLSAAVVLGLGGVYVMRGAMTVGMLVAFQSLMQSFLQPVNQLVALGGQLQDLRGDLTRLDDVLRYDQAPVFARDQRAQAAWDPDLTKLSGAVRLRDITFGYSPLAAPLIDGFELDLEPGSRVALVGPSGSGKSTVARILAGLYEPWSGEIRFDGHLDGDIPRSVLVNSISMVDQDILLFEGTIRENLTMWDVTYPEGDVVRAAKDACIHDVLASRPGGYEGRVDEMGQNFSGGQRQRIEIARALVTNPSVLVLDEATSALDPVTELEIDRNLRRRGCTCVIVAHRLSTIRDCDEIIVLRDGAVVERGTHDDLYAQRGLYADLIGAGGELDT